MTGKNKDYARVARELVREAVTDLRDTGDWPLAAPLETRLWGRGEDLDDLVAECRQSLEFRGTGDERRLQVVPRTLLEHGVEGAWLAPLATWARDCAERFAGELASVPDPAIELGLPDILRYWPRRTEALAVARLVWNGLGFLRFVRATGYVGNTLETVKLRVEGEALLFRHTASVNEMIQVDADARAIAGTAGEPDALAVRLLQEIWRQTRTNGAWPTVRDLVLAWDGPLCVMPFLESLVNRRLCRATSDLAMPSLVKLAGVGALAYGCAHDDGTAFIGFVQAAAAIRLERGRDEAIDLEDIAQRASIHITPTRAIALVAHEDLVLGMLHEQPAGWNFQAAKTIFKLREATTLLEYQALRAAHEQERSAAMFAPLAQASTPSIFYSWQNVAPSKYNRNLIEAALKAAIAALPSGSELTQRLRLDQDARGEPGAVDIRDAVFAKIDRCEAFVADVTLVGSLLDGRPTPNPNVLFELGYAWKRLGEKKILLVMNTQHGAVEDLPFDLRGHLVLTYSYGPEDGPPAEVRRALTERLRDGLDAILAGAGSPRAPTPTSTRQLLDSRIRGLSEGDRGLFRSTYAEILDTNSGIVEFERLIEIGAAAGLDEQGVTDSAEILSNDGLWRATEVIGKYRYSDVVPTPLGMDAYCRSFVEGFATLLDAVAIALVRDDARSSEEVATRLGKPSLLIEHVLAGFQTEDLITCSEHSAGIDVVELKPKLRRRFPAAGGAPRSAS